jgi:hypothetical protein
MERQKAIDSLAYSVEREIEEFCIGDEERKRAYAEAREAFHALGITDEELGDFA